MLVLVVVRTLAGFAVRLFLVRVLVRIITGVGLIVRIVSELVGIAKVTDELTGKPGKFHLVRKHLVQLFQRFTRLFEKAILELFADLARNWWKLATGGKSADRITDCITKRCFVDVRLTAIPLPFGLVRYLCIDICSRTGHTEGSNCFTTRRFKGLVEFSRSLAKWHVFGVRIGIVQPLA